jgi:hypothetical protein
LASLAGDAALDVYTKPSINFLQWDYSSPPRVIEIRSWGNISRVPLTPIKFSIPPQKPPVIFRINHESRQEALRSYTLIEIGVSTSTLDPNQEYLDWEHHPSNPYRRFRLHMPETRHSLATPYPAQKTYVNFDRDTIYLGPEFQFQHLRSFFTATGPKMELTGLQYLAIDRKLWICNTDRLNGLLTALHSLLSRPLKEIYIIPDDTRGSLDDRFYYCEHEIAFQQPLYRYTFRLPHSDVQEKAIVDNLREWFEKCWKEGGKGIPSVEIKSVRRNGRCLASFKDGVWEVQKVLGDMEYWKNWSLYTPPTL